MLLNENEVGTLEQVRVTNDIFILSIIIICLI